MIPKYILDELAEEDLPHLLEIRDYLDRLITNRQGSFEEVASKAETEERRPGSVTYRQEWVYCGKECKKCPHGPYWYCYCYCYWKEDGKPGRRPPSREGARRRGRRSDPSSRSPVRGVSRIRYDERTVFMRELR